jgi:integrase
MIALRQWQLKCPLFELDPFFPKDGGNTLNHQKMINWFLLLTLENGGLAKIHFHDLRHTKTADTYDRINRFYRLLIQSTPTAIAK